MLGDSLGSLGKLSDMRHAWESLEKLWDTLGHLEKLVKIWFGQLWELQSNWIIIIFSSTYKSKLILIQANVELIPLKSRFDSWLIQFGQMIIEYKQSKYMKTKSKRCVYVYITVRPIHQLSNVPGWGNKRKWEVEALLIYLWGGVHRPRYCLVMFGVVSWQDLVHFNLILGAY